VINIFIPPSLSCSGLAYGDVQNNETLLQFKIMIKIDWFSPVGFMFGETCSVQKSSFRYKNLCARILEIFSELLHSNDLNLHTIRTFVHAYLKSSTNYSCANGLNWKKSKLRIFVLAKFCSFFMRLRFRILWAQLIMRKWIDQSENGCCQLVESF